MDMLPCGEVVREGSLCKPYNAVSCQEKALDEVVSDTLPISASVYFGVAVVCAYLGRPFSRSSSSPSLRTVSGLLEEFVSWSGGM